MHQNDLPVSRSACFVGVDYGGTWTRVRARGRASRACRFPSPPLARLPGALKNLFRRWKIRPDALVIGARGVWTRSERLALERRLSAFAGRVRAVSDVELTHWAAFRGKPGIFVIAGTGSIAYGRDARGRFARAGGLGPEKGDEGSAYWIGKRWRERLGRRGRSVRNTAALAQEVLERASRKDAAATQLVREAWVHLSVLAGEVRRALRLKGPVPVACAGGLFERSPGFRRGFYGTLKERAGGMTAFKGRPRNAEDAAAELASGLGTADSPLGLLYEFQEIPDFR